MSGTPHEHRPSAIAERVLLFLPLVLTVLLAKVSLPPFSTMGLGIALPLVLSVTFAGVCLGHFELDVGRLTLYLLLLSWAAITQLRGAYFSILSLVFLLLVFFPLILRLKPSSKNGDQSTTALQSLASTGLVVAILGLAQYAIQFAFNSTIAFPLEHILPQGVLIEGFNYMNPLYYSSPIYKPNGMFFLEPSFFSQFLAVALLAELSTRNRILGILVLAAALASTFSGTGLIVLAAGGFALVISRRKLDLVMMAIAIAAVLIFAAEYLQLGIFLDRSGELSRVGSSGFERFVAWTYLVEDQLWTDATKAWGGFGAGSFSSYSQVARYHAWESSFAKMLFEFGIPGLVFYFLFLFYSMSTAAAPASIKFGLATCTLMNGAYSESNVGLFLTLLLWPSRNTMPTIHAWRKQEVVDPPSIRYQGFRFDSAHRKLAVHQGGQAKLKDDDPQTTDADGAYKFTTTAHGHLHSSHRL